MSNEFLNDHEQSEQVRNWLKANANALTFGVILGLGALLGWRWWQGNVETQKAQVAAQYVELKKSAEEKNLDQLKAQTGTMVADFSKSGYSALAQLRLAQLALDKGDKVAATSALQWVIEKGATEEFKNIAKVRLARLHNSDGKFDEAIKVLATVKQDSFAGVSAEVRGDALLGLNKASEARAAYQQALDKMEAGAGNRSFIEMKRNSIAATEVAG
jgi:predicted negative regulator of RcsB-dependent stress response